MEVGPICASSFTTTIFSSVRWNKYTYLLGLLGDLNEIMHVKCLAQEVQKMETVVIIVFH